MHGPDRVLVRVPATSANLGTGFDAIGVAVQIYARLTVELGRQPEGVSDSANAAVRTHGPLRRTRSVRRGRCPLSLASWRLTSTPIFRSPAAWAPVRRPAAAGLVAGNAMLHGALTDQQLLDLGTELEGHADNIAPALFGGCQVAATTTGSVERVALPVAAGLKFVGFVPSFTMPTQASRELLPRSLSRTDSVHNSSRSALLVAALTTGRWEALRTAVDDRLHQRPRSQLFPTLFDFIAAAERGAHGPPISPAAVPTVMALSSAEAAERVRAALEQCAAANEIEGWGLHHTDRRARRSGRRAQRERLSVTVVQKYGGTSVGSVERLQAVAARVAARADRGVPMAVVVSAMGKTTDELVALSAPSAPGPRAAKPTCCSPPARSSAAPCSPWLSRNSATAQSR